MALPTDDIDIRNVRLYMEAGGNGDYYLNLVEQKEGQPPVRINMRISMSGGFAPTEVKLAVAELFRAMDGAGLNEHQ
jgi:hypothetical protein